MSRTEVFEQAVELRCSVSTRTAR